MKTVKKNIIFPEELLNEADVLRRELNMDFSKLMRAALTAYLATVKKERIAMELEAEAAANRDFYRSAGKDFESLGLETWR